MLFVHAPRGNAEQEIGADKRGRTPRTNAGVGVTAIAPGQASQELTLGKYRPRQRPTNGNWLSIRRACEARRNIPAHIDRP
jgi:hypothetical protein